MGIYHRPLPIPITRAFSLVILGKKMTKAITGDELIDFVNNELFPTLKALATASGVSEQGRVIGSVFEDAYKL